MNTKAYELNKTVNYVIMNAWWIVPLVVMVSWAVGASICWAQGGRISELGWYWIKCVSR